MSERLPWNKLSRAHQKALERLWAGGTLRGRDADIVAGLRSMGYIHGNRLTQAGEELCAAALTAIVGRMKETVAPAKIRASARR